MKQPIHSKEFGRLADKGWNDLAERLNREMPVEKPVRKPIAWLPRILAAVTLLFVFMLGYSFESKKHRAPFQPIPNIVNNISFEVPQPIINLRSPMAHLDAAQPVLAEKIDMLQKTLVTSVEIEKINEVGQARKLNMGQKEFQFGVFDYLPFGGADVKTTQKNDLSTKIVEFEKIPKKVRYPKLGFNLNSSTHGLFESSSIGGGVSISFPIGKKFSVEPGVGYDLMKIKEIKAEENSEFSLARALMATPSLNVKYRVRQSIEMPLSFHYQPIRQIAFTGGVDVGLLITQRMVFETNSFSNQGFDSYKKQLNDSELNQLERFNFGAHGGVAWQPSQNWKLGVYYGQNILNKKKETQPKLKFSNHVFKVRMAHYF